MTNTLELEYQKNESTEAVGNNSKAECIKQTTQRLFNDGREMQKYFCFL